MPSFLYATSANKAISKNIPAPANIPSNISTPLIGSTTNAIYANIIPTMNPAKLSPFGIICAFISTNASIINNTLLKTQMKSQIYKTKLS